MFRRKRSSSNPPRPGTTTPSAAATLAASQAFLAKQTNDAALSSSAAAAALRSHTTTPTPVAHVQTKRMQRRASQSSINSAPSRPGGLQRRGSGGSMTERSFREPSPVPLHRPPERPASSHGPYPRYDNEAAPPVPALPDRYASPVARMRSPEPTLPKVKPRTQRKADDAIDVTPESSARSPPTPTQLSSTKTDASSVAHQAANQANNRASVNFSRPMSPQNVPSLASTPGSRTKSPGRDGKILPSLTQREADQMAATINKAADRPVKKKKKKAVKPVEGQHLQTQLANKPEVQTQAAKPRAEESTLRSLEQPGPASKELASASATSPVGRSKKASKSKASDSASSQDREDNFGNAYPSDTDSVASDVSSTTDRSRATALRPKGTLGKQPSTVREDRAGEEFAENKTPAPKTTEPVKVSDQGKMTKSKSIAASQPKDSSKDSLNPSRALHFSVEPVYESPGGTKHQPLGRSASPAKSAMKNSPSRGQSPSLLRTQGLAGELSDTASVPSDDGGQASQKKRRNVRVSFDSSSVTVGQAASPVSTGSPVLASPQNRSAPKAPDGRGHPLEQKLDESELDLGDTSIRPTPILPSFGSIRDKKEQEILPKTDGDIEKVAPEIPNDEVRGAASDHNTGTVLSQDNPHHNAVTQSASAVDPDPAPRADSLPQSGTNDGQDPVSFDQVSSEPRTGSGEDTAHLKSGLQPNRTEAEGLVPSIAVLPATPAADVGSAESKEWLEMPGGFPGGKGPSQSGQQTQHVLPARSTDTPPMDSDATLEAQRQEEGAAAPSTVPDATNTAQPPDNIAAHNAENDSVYSDAAEDQTETENEGYGSINAVVKRPIQVNTESATLDESTQHPHLASEAGQGRAPALIPSQSHKEGHQEPQGYWSGLTEVQKQQLEHAALPGAIEERNLPDRTLRGKGSIAKQPKPKPSNPKGQSKPRVQDTATGSKAISTHGRASQDIQSPPLTLNKGVLQKKGRPVSAMPSVEYDQQQPMASGVEPKPASKPRQGRSSATAAKGPIAKPQKPKLGRTTSNGSDSNSSFKRLRPARPETGRYQMRRSMRSTGGDSQYTPSRSPSNTQEPSMTAARRPFSQAGGRGTRMRTSLRESADTTKPTRDSLRHSTDASKLERTKSPSRLSFLGAKTRLGHNRANSKADSARLSRFDDSSDEDSRLPQLRSSRFADSSDEESVDLAPVRGIPRTINEGDSTELEDSSVENMKAPNSGKSTETQPTTVSSPSSKPGGTALSIGSMRASNKGKPPTPVVDTSTPAMPVIETEKKKRSFFGTLARKRKDEPSRSRLFLSEAFPNDQSGSRAEITTPSKPSGTSASPTIGTPVSGLGDSQGSAKSPKLQRRNTPKGVANVNGGPWPLSQNTGAGSDPPSRPRTSDGPTPSSPSARPDLGTRRITLQSAPDAEDIENAGKKKKKRFPMLRRALGLNK